MIMNIHRDAARSCVWGDEKEDVDVCFCRTVCDGWQSVVCAQDTPWIGMAYGMVYLTDVAMNKTEMTSSLYSSPLQNYQVRLDLNASWQTSFSIVKRVTRNGIDA